MKRITVSISDELQEWIDENIKKKRFHNYQHAVEYCLQQEMNRNRET